MLESGGESGGSQVHGFNIITLPEMLQELIDILVCPHCGGALRENNGALVCSKGHTNNIARQGYVSLLGRDAGTHTADSVEMVAARERFLGAGHYEPIAAAIADALGEVESEAPFADIGSGPGWYLGQLVDREAGRFGLAVDNSKFAARKAAKVHPRVGAVVADIWDELPVADGSVAAAINVFSPRNGSEIHRILEPGGRLVVVTPGADHLKELIGPFGMISVDPDKQERLERTLGEDFDAADAGPKDIHWEMALSREAVADLVGMGPSADRLDKAALAGALAGLDDVTKVTASVQVSAFTARPEIVYVESAEADEDDPDVEETFDDGSEFEHLDEG